MGCVCLQAASFSAASGTVRACRTSKKRVDCKIKEAYKLGKTLGTGGKLWGCMCWPLKTCYIKAIAMGAQLAASTSACMLGYSAHQQRAAGRSSCERGWCSETMQRLSCTCGSANSSSTHA